ncbi:MAG: hypothetical protein ABI843_12090 [Dokdonella sp.]
MRLLPCLALLFASSVFAQGKTDYTLNEGKVRFRVPPSWTAIMEKSDGNPQAVAFQVPDETAQGSDDSANVTVKTRALGGSAEFTGAVQEELDRVRAQAGYEKDASNKDESFLQYFVQRGQTRYVVRDSFALIGNIVAHVRCQRPLLDKTPAAWTTQFDSACNGVTASLKQLK